MQTCPGPQTPARGGGHVAGQAVARAHGGTRRAVGGRQLGDVEEVLAAGEAGQRVRRGGEEKEESQEQQYHCRVYLGLMALVLTILY